MNNKNIKLHNGEISILKFLFALLILAFHLGGFYDKFNYGYIGVEFFFIVSGFFFCKNLLNKKVKDSEIPSTTYEYLKKNFLKFISYYLILYLLAIPISFLIDKFSVIDFVSAFFGLFSLPVPNIKLGIYGITWYINAMILIEFILYPLLLKFKDKIVYIVSPVVIFFSLSFLLINYGIIGDPWQSTTFCFKGIVRALMDINIGIFMYGIIDKLKDTKLTEFSRFIITILEIIGYILVAYLSNKHTVVVEFAMLLIIILCLFVTLSEKDYLNEFSNNKFFYYLEKLSLPIYVFQFIFIRLIMYLNIKFTWNLNFTKSFILLVVVSILFGILVLKLFNFFSKHKEQVKEMFIKK